MRRCWIENEQLFKQRSLCLHLMRQAFVLLLCDDSSDQGRWDAHKPLQMLWAPDKWSKAKAGSVFFLLRKAIEVWIMYINAKQTVKGEKKEQIGALEKKEIKSNSKVGCKRLKNTGI